ncbi:glucose-6-phosphate isomerase [Phaeobacter sp. NW0010-22]|uniref:glucose-6-phosphate isomerase n=1 Tax=Phaeobacter sp. NW0010-22 TaxID=3135907 RepID=UPI0031060B22
MFERLRTLHTAVKDRSIFDLFQRDVSRAEQFSIDTDNLRFDFSKTQIDEDILQELGAFCKARKLDVMRENLFSGALINETEGRAALHTALRNLDGDPVYCDGQDVMPEVLATLERMQAFAKSVRSGAITGPGGGFLDVVNIGIGGSDLGPAMAALALTPYQNGPRCHFVSNIDGAHITDTLHHLDPRRTLVIVASKSFTTVEAIMNAKAARDWVLAGGGDPAAQFVALSTAVDKTREFGIPSERVFGFSDWVGGRYSIWGPIGLSLMIGIGCEDFNAFLLGGQAMDRHFRTTAWSENMPVMLALTGLWHHQICGYPTRAVIPYEQRLSRLPAYLQQLEMESNGKSIAMDGSDLTEPSGPIVWGEPGTNAQHAFFQLIHQGTIVVPCEFLVGALGHEKDLKSHHQLLVANCLAQSEALMRGRSADETRILLQEPRLSAVDLERQVRHRVFEGNRPSTTLIYPKLTPYVLGQIIALYEHRVFVEGALLGLNSYDQWGVELGKTMATSLVPVVAGEIPATGKDGSTAGLVDYVLKHRDV